MALTLEDSRIIFWGALKNALNLTYEPGELKDFFEESSYVSLFSGISGNAIDYDRSVALRIIEEYHEHNAEVDYSLKKIKNKSRKLRGDKNAKIYDFFIWTHNEVYDFS